MGKKYVPITNIFHRRVSTATAYGGANFSKCPDECNLNPIQVRYQAALHPDLSPILLNILA